MGSPSAQAARRRSSRAFQRATEKMTSSSGSPMIRPVAVAAIVIAAMTTANARIDAGSVDSW